MPVTITEIGTYAGQVTPTTIPADADFFGNDSLRYAVDVTLGGSSAAGDAIFLQIATHWGGISWSTFSGRFTITDSAGNTYDRFGDASVISGCRHGVINFIARNAAAISGTLEIRIKGLKASAAHVAPHDLPFCVQVTKVAGLNFPASLTAPNAGASTGNADLGVSGGSVNYNTQAAITSGVRYFAVAALAYEPGPGDSLSETANSFAAATTSEVAHTPGTTDAGPGFADHYDNLGLRVRFREGTSGGGNFGPTYGHTTTQGTAHYGQLVAWFVVTSIGGGRISAAISPTRRRLRARTDDGALKIDRFTDANPPAVAATITVETREVTGCDLIWAGRTRRGPIGDLVYTRSGTAYARRSLDGGRTWSVADTIASGYQDIAQAVDLGRGIKIVALYKESEQKWYGVVGRMNSGGTGWEFPTAPAVLVSNAKAGAALVIRPDRVAEFTYRTTADAITTVRGNAYAVSALGSFA